MVKTSDEAHVLLYCHGDFFALDKDIVEVLDLSYKLIDKTNPKKIDSINIDETKLPTYLSSDGNLPKELLGKFNVVVDYNCDYTGWSVNERQFDKFTKPLYKNMVKALNPKAFCFITNFEKPNFETTSPNDERLKERINKAEEKRIDFINLLIKITTHCEVENIIIEGKRKTYIIFFCVQND